MAYKKRIAGAVNTVNGQTGDVKVADMIFVNVPFNGTFDVDDVIAIATLPANARIVNVSIASRSFLAEEEGFINFELGYGAAGDFLEDTDAFLTDSYVSSLFLGTGSALFTSPTFGDVKKNVAIPIIATVTSGATFINQTLSICLEYIQE